MSKTAYQNAIADIANKPSVSQANTNTNSYTPKYIKYRSSSKNWVSKTYGEVPISSMGDFHLDNAIKMIEKQAGKELNHIVANRPDLITKWNIYGSKEAVAELLCPIYSDLIKERDSRVKAGTYMEVDSPTKNTAGIKIEISNAAPVKADNSAKTSSKAGLPQRLDEALDEIRSFLDEEVGSQEKQELSELKDYPTTALATSIDHAVNTLNFYYDHVSVLESFTFSDLLLFNTSSVADVTDFLKFGYKHNITFNTKGCRDIFFFLIQYDIASRIASNQFNQKDTLLYRYSIIAEAYSNYTNTGRAKYLDTKSFKNNLKYVIRRIKDIQVKFYTEVEDMLLFAEGQLTKDFFTPHCARKFELLTEDVSAEDLAMFRDNGVSLEVVGLNCTFDSYLDSELFDLNLPNLSA